MTRRPWAALLFTAVSGISIGAVSTSHAAGEAVSSDSRAVAEMLFFTARGLMEAGRVADACVKLAESYRLDPAAGTLLNLAVCHEKEGKLATAWGDFRQALADARKSNRPDREELAKEHIAVLEPDLPFLSIIVPESMRVKGLEVIRNGTPMSPATWDTELPVDPGMVEVLTRAPLYKDKGQKVEIAKKEHKSVTLEALVLAPVYLPPPPFWTVRREIGAGLIGLGVAGIVAGAVTGELATSSVSSSDTNCPVYLGDRRCNSTGVSDMNNAKTYALISDIGFAAGGVSLVAGVVMMALKTHHEGPVAPEQSAWAPASWTWNVATTAHGTQGFIGHSF